MAKPKQIKGDVKKTMGEIAANRKAKFPKPKITKFTQLLDHVLTPNEIQQISRRMAEDYHSIPIKEELLAQAQKQGRNEISTIQARIAEAAEKVGSGKEFRLIDCEATVDYKKDLKTVTRMDTKKVLSKGPIPSDERQVKLPLSEPGEMRV